MATILIPSFLYWTSGLHKEGLIFTGISLVIYAIYFGLKEKRFGIIRILSLLTGLLLLLVLRNFIIVIIIPAIIAWLVANRKPKHGLAIFGSLYLLYIVLFFYNQVYQPSIRFSAGCCKQATGFYKYKGRQFNSPH